MNAFTRLVPALLLGVLLLVPPAFAGKGGKGGGKPGDDGGGASSEATIAFAKQRKRGGLDLAVTDSTGTSVTTLVSSAGSLFVEADWSPDGMKIAFYGTVQGAGIYVVDADGKNLTKIAVTTEGYTSNVAWSPVADADGSFWILFDDDGGDGGMWGNSDLFVVKPDGTERTNLTATTGRSESCGVWSHDALEIATIAASHTAGMPNDILVLSVDLVNGALEAGSEVNVTHVENSPLMGQFIYHVDWARTDDVLAVAAVPPNGTDADIFILDLAAPSNAWNLTLTSGTEERGPSWSSDDASIVYWTPGGKAKLMSIDAAGQSSPSEVLSGGLSPACKR